MRWQIAALVEIVGQLCILGYWTQLLEIGKLVIYPLWTNLGKKERELLHKFLKLLLYQKSIDELEKLVALADTQETINALHLNDVLQFR